MTNLFRVASWYFIIVSLTFCCTIVVYAAQAISVHGTTSSDGKSSVGAHSPSLRQFQHWLAVNGYGNEPAVLAPPAPTPFMHTGKRPVLASHLRASHAGSRHNAVPLARQQIVSPPMSAERSRAIILAAAPKDNLIAETEDSTNAFRNVIQQHMPLSPRQVVQLRQQMDIEQQAAAIPANVPPKPVSTTLMINLAPGTTPPAVRLAEGYVSSLVFVDATGASWPIAALDIGNPKMVSAQWDGKSNILLLQALAPYSNGNIVIRLVGLTTPITLELVSGQRVVDYRTDIHVSGLGPNAKELPTVTLPSSASKLLLNVLDGVAPPGSRLLTVIGGAADTQAWLLHEKLYLRTRLTLLSPGWIGKMTSPDGMQAYELQQTSSVLVSRYGDPVELKIEGL